MIRVVIVIVVVLLITAASIDCLGFGPAIFGVCWYGLSQGPDRERERGGVSNHLDRELWL